MSGPIPFADRTDLAQPEPTLESSRILAAIAEFNPELAAGFENLKVYRQAAHGDDTEPEDVVPADYSWLLDFEYEGKKLNSGDIAFILNLVKGKNNTPYHGFDQYGRFKHTPSADNPETADPRYFPAMKPVVQMALHEITRDARERYQVSVSKVVRELMPLVTSNIVDVVDVSPGGMVVKDLRNLPRELTAGIAEVQETRNAQGVQIRIKMHDKIAAISALTRLCGLNREKAQINEVTINIGERLDNALARLKNQTLDGELVVETPALEAPNA